MARQAGAELAFRVALLAGPQRPPEPDRSEIGRLGSALDRVGGTAMSGAGPQRQGSDQNSLARLLKPLAIGPGNVGPEHSRARGYKRR
jgi:hypothetical protein